jgi:lysozyme family protein
MKANFRQSLAYLLKDEGGNDDDPADHGGRTSRGITQREYTSWRKKQGLPNRDVWTATTKEIETIYHDEYWDPHCDLLPSGTDYLYFDMAVNAGPSRATKLLQKALGVTADGAFGPNTKRAVEEANVKDLIKKYTEVKRAFYIGLNQPRFTKGWMNRCNNVAANANALAKAPIPAPVPTPTPTPVPAPQRTFWQVLLEFIIQLFRKK